MIWKLAPRAVTSTTPCARAQVSKDRVHADLAELASGRKQGRLTADELVIFDSSGSGVQDVAAAWAAYQEADRLGVGLRFDLSGKAK